MLPDPLTAALAIGAFFVGGFVKGAIGLGLPVVVLATLALVMPLREAMAVFLIPGLVSNFWQATNGPHLPAIVRRLWSYMIAGIIGIAIGVSIMAGTKSQAMVVVLGVLLIAYSLHALLAPRIPAPGRHEVWMSPAAAGVGGVLFGMAGIFIVPGILYLEALRMPRDQFVQALGVTFMTITGGLAIFMTSHALVTWPLAILSAIGLLPVLLGLWFGRRARRHISEQGFRKIFFYALIVSGIYMIVRNWQSVFGG